VTDLELADAFFSRLKEKGYPIERTLNGNEPGDDSYVVFEIKDAWKNTAFEFDFLGGKFYRISGYTSDSGHWNDELDFGKYC
jgi:hypothetical protein